MSLEIDQNIIYQSKVQEISQMIKKLEEFGLDMQEYQKELLMIEDTYKQEIKKGYGRNGTVVAMEQASNIQLCLTQIRRLDALQKDLQTQFNDYVCVLNSCEILEDYINKDSFLTKDEINKMIDEINRNMDVLKSSSAIRWQEEESLVNRTYHLAYKTILLEKYTLGTSSLLNSIKIRFPYALPSINQLFMSDFKTADLNVRENKAFRIRMNEIEQEDLASNYLDSELIGLFVQMRPPYSVHIIQDRKKAIETKIEELKDQQKLAHITQENNEEIIGQAQGNVKKFRSKMIRNLVVYAVSIGTVAAIGAGATHLIKNSRVYHYQTTQQVYVEGRQEQPEPTISFQEDKENTATVIVNGLWEWDSYQSGYVRTLTFYDVCDFEYDDIRSYLDIDLDKLEATKHPQEVKTYLLPEDQYSHPYRVIMAETQDKQVYSDDTNYENIENAIGGLHMAIGGVSSALALLMLIKSLNSLRKILKEKHKGKEAKNLVTQLENHLTQIEEDIQKYEIDLTTLNKDLRGKKFVKSVTANRHFD